MKMYGQWNMNSKGKLGVLQWLKRNRKSLDKEIGLLESGEDVHLNSKEEENL